MKTTLFCSTGEVGTYPDCRKPTCPPGTTGTYPNCVKPVKPQCAPGTIYARFRYIFILNKRIQWYQLHYLLGEVGNYPDCRRPTCPTGTTGTYPNCVTPQCAPGKTYVSLIVILSIK